MSESQTSHSAGIEPIEECPVSLSALSLEFSAMEHLSEHGIDASTITGGLALGREISIGYQRDSRLVGTLSEFTPSTNEMAILANLCISKEGRAIATLCWFLSIGYDENYAGEVLGAIAERLEVAEPAQVPETQWVLLVRLCAAAFNGDKLQDNMKAILGMGLSNPPTLPLSISTKEASQSLSETLVDLSQALSGRLRGVHVTGLDQCGWVAIWVEEALDLRLEVYDQEGEVRRRTFKDDTEEAQVTVRFVKLQGLPTSLLTVVTEA